tara:strand:- start:459 stop:866 length:408 start_codon:yes stop_codon:yes gene_type:complete
MLKTKGKINLILLVFNIFCLLYYSIQLLAFTDEFVSSNIGFFNHAVAGLSEIIGIIFFCLAVGLSIIVFRGANNQLPLLATVFLMQIIISLNFWRYVITDNPGETSISIIMFNAFVFSLMSFSMLILIIRLKRII